MQHLKMKVNTKAPVLEVSSCCRLVAQSCLTLCNSMDCSSPAPLSMGFLISCIGRQILYHWVSWETLDVPYAAYHLLSASNHRPTWDAGVISSTYSTIITFDSRARCRNTGIRATFSAVASCSCNVGLESWHQMKLSPSKHKWKLCRWNPSEF